MPGARSGPSPAAVEGSSPTPPGTSAPGGGQHRSTGLGGSPPGPGRCRVPSPPVPTHQPPVDEVGQEGTGPGAEEPPVRHADLPETGVSTGDTGPHQPPTTSPAGSPPSPFVPSGEDSGSGSRGWADRQTDSPGRSGAGSRTEAAGRARCPLPGTLSSKRRWWRRLRDGGTGASAPGGAGETARGESPGSPGRGGSDTDTEREGEGRERGQETGRDESGPTMRHTEPPDPPFRDPPPRCPPWASR